VVFTGLLGYFCAYWQAGLIERLFDAHLIGYLSIKSFDRRGSIRLDHNDTVQQLLIFCNIIHNSDNQVPKRRNLYIGATHDVDLGITHGQ
jgi:hypothetical protein